MKYALAALALLVIGAIWWRALEPSRIEVSRDPQETWVSPPSPTPGLAYKRYRIVLSNGDIVHATGSHYVWDKGGVGLSIKDAGTNSIVFNTDKAESVGLE